MMRARICVLPLRRLIKTGGLSGLSFTHRTPGLLHDALDVSAGKVAVCVPGGVLTGDQGAQFGCRVIAGFPDPTEYLQGKVARLKREDVNLSLDVPCAGPGLFHPDGLHRERRGSVEVDGECFGHVKPGSLGNRVHAVHERRSDVGRAEFVAFWWVGFDGYLQHAGIVRPCRETDEPAPKLGARVHLDFRCC